MAKTFHVALAGNPNTGKSTLFSALTGNRQRIGNWPGTTVAQRVGWFTIGDTEIRIVDLPGTYSLSAYSPEEQITRDYIIFEQPDALINVIDASKLERNLYLTAQILEIGIPLILALNMSDLAAKLGYHIDLDLLQAELPSVPIVSMAASQGTGLDDLRSALIKMTTESARPTLQPVREL
jgi:ferrous iron transport protein B